jgi:hypothetical protein
LARAKGPARGDAGENPAEGGLDIRLVNRHLDVARFVHGVEDATIFSELQQFRDGQGLEEL